MNDGRPNYELQHVIHSGFGLCLAWASLPVSDFPMQDENSVGL